MESLWKTVITLKVLSHFLNIWKKVFLFATNRPLPGLGQVMSIDLSRTKQTIHIGLFQLWRQVVRIAVDSSLETLIDVLQTNELIVDNLCRFYQEEEEIHENVWRHCEVQASLGLQDQIKPLSLIYDVNVYKRQDFTKQIVHQKYNNSTN